MGKLRRADSRVRAGLPAPCVRRLTYQVPAGRPPDRDMLTDTHTSRSLERRRVYLGEGLTFEIEVRDGLAGGRGDRPHPRGPRRRGDPRHGRHDAGGGRESSASATRGAGPRAPASRRWCGTSAVCRPRAGRCRGSGSRSCRDDQRSPTSIGARASAIRAPRRCAAFAAASCPWFFGETLHFRIVQVGAGGMTLRTTHPDPPLPPRAELDLELHLASIAHERGRARLTSVRRDEPRRGPRGRGGVGRPAARAAQRPVALSAGRRREAHARPRCASAASPSGASSRRSSTTTRLPTATTTRSSPCACTPTRPRGTSTVRRPRTCARPSTPTRAI